ncbi:DUF2304 domain-containing protein [Corynebacterium mendelii]|uniref:DUF2304 domain-containing protein n=1 Tax=Corynebacterium mendelii TaxID=2765362 RepID=A0A939DZQ2_9CORY|nr:DUF2304 domain-containing protein [Corynebacterium mendelii]MBN9643799.1 DUF2304 domain-containing protein [Corynebacterium mendelii]
MGQFFIQLLLVVATIGLVVYFLTNRRKARAKAGVKIGFVIFVLAAFWAVLRPDDLTVVARFVGVSRGTDLLLYAVTVAFFFTTLSAWIRFREQDLRYARLARAMALTTAVRPEDNYPDINHSQPATPGADDPPTVRPPATGSGH